MTDNTSTDEEIQARFDAAEARTHQLEKQVLAETPTEVIDKFRIGEGKELFGTLLIAPGMELDEGLYCVQASVEADQEAGVAPHELILVRSYAGPTDGPEIQGNWRKTGLPIPHGVPVVMIRSAAPTETNLLPEELHYFTVRPDTTWDMVVDWAQALVSMEVLSAGS